MERTIDRTEDLNYVIDFAKAPRLPEIEASFEDFLAVIVRQEAARLDRTREQPAQPRAVLG